MPLPRKLLTEGESVVVELHPTWLVLGWPLVLSVCAAVLAIAVTVVFGDLPAGVGWVLLAMVVIPVCWLGVRWVRWRTTTIVLTTSRILERRGVLARQVEEIRLDRINELSYRQSLLERMLRTGSLVVEVGGETGVVLFSYLPQPGAVQSLITEQIDAMRRARFGWPAPNGGAPTGGPSGAPTPVYAPPPGMPPPPAPQLAQSAGPTVAERLVALDDLRQRGILTETEFQAKKVELLRQL